MLVGNVRGFLALAMSMVLLGCDDPEPAAQTERVRAIKPFTVSERAGGLVRSYSGKISPAETSVLSFAVAGTVAEILVEEGDTVVVGQILASLDRQAFDLDMDAARADLAQAQASAQEADLNLERKAALYEKEWIAKAAYDNAVAAAQTARGAVDLARAQLGQVERNLDKTNLRAPFDGVIAERAIEPFVEVGAGSAVFAINSADGLEVEFAVPDLLAGRLEQGLSIDVSVETIANCGCQATITEIGSVADTANAVSVVAAIREAPGDLIPGMTAEVQVILQNDDGEAGYLIPLVAVTPGEAAGKGYVFKYDADAGVVRRVEVTGQEGRDNLVQVNSGVEAGDILAAAGVSFLRDGQAVKLLGQ